MSKKYCIFISALFCAFIGLFLVANAATPSREFSEMENRNLEQMPKLSVDSLLSGQFMKDFETYTTDQFVGRDLWIALKSSSERILGKHENNDVYFCDQDTLITRFDQPDAAKVSENVNYVNSFVENVDIPVTFSLIPTQACIWAGRLPDGAPNASQTGLLDQAQSAVSGATWADLYSPLWEHKDEDIFYRTDHHWTSLGAYYGYTALMEAMGVTPEPLGEAVTVSEDFNGTLYSSSGVHWLTPDTMERYVDGEGITVTVNDGMSLSTHGLYVEENLAGKDKYTYFMGGNNPLYIIRNPNAATDETLLVVRDSYSDSLIPFLTQYYSEIHVIDLRYYRVPVAAYAESMEADAIFVCYSVENFQKEDNVIFLGQ